MANKAVKEKIPFERCVLTKAQLLELFKVCEKIYLILFVLLKKFLIEILNYFIILIAYFFFRITNTRVTLLTVRLLMVLAVLFTDVVL